MKTIIYQTAKDTDLRITNVEVKTNQEADFKIELDSNNQYQEHMGFGGAFTEAAAFTLSEVSEDKREEAINAYFSKDGLNYNLGRVHIHSCDFALGNYTYIEEGDSELKTFDISHEDKWVIPFIKDSMALMDEELLILGSPWSPPAFMKDTNEMNNGGRLLPEFRSSWAKYYVKFIEEMAKKGVPIWGVSVQNEPAAVQTWDSCIYSAEDERDFVKGYLGPELHEAGMKDVALLVWDHNRDIIVERSKPILEDEEAAKYVWGVGNHWYVSEEFEKLGQVHDMFPDKHLLFTEGCVEYSIYGNDPKWENGEFYGRNIIGDFNNWSRGWIDWNLVLNEIGGPNHVHNYCEAPIMADRTKDELIYNISYWYLGHFSKFIKRGALRIGMEATLPNKVYAVAYQNPNGDIVTVIQNESEENLVVELNGSFSLPKRSISTFITNNEV